MPFADISVFFFLNEEPRFGPPFVKGNSRVLYSDSQPKRIYYSALFSDTSHSSFFSSELYSCRFIFVNFYSPYSRPARLSIQFRAVPSKQPILFQGGSGGGWRRGFVSLPTERLRDFFFFLCQRNNRVKKYVYTD